MHPMMTMATSDLEVLRSARNHIRYVQGVTTLNKCHHALIKMIQENDRVAVRACHGIGKTFSLGRIVPWFLTTHPNSKVLTTAPTNRQVNHLLWAEIRKAHKNAIVPLGGKILETPHWKIGEDWYALGYSPEKGKRGEREGESSQSAFQGFHAENMLIVIDEATGIPPAIWNQIEGMATSGNVKIVAIGNPTTKNCHFYSLFGSRAWANMHLSVFDSPNLSCNRLYNIDALRIELKKLLEMSPREMQHRFSQYTTKNASLVTAKWVMTRALPDEWGIDSVPFRTRCLGEFPEIESDVFFPDDLIASTINREVPGESRVRYYGLDPARFGTDASVLTILDGHKLSARIEMHGKDGMAQANRVAKEIIARPRLPDEKVIVDATGVGGPILDRLIEMQSEGLIPKDITFVEFHNGGSAGEEEDPEATQKRDNDRWANKKAKALDLLAQDMSSISIPELEAPVYKRELPTLIYDYDSKGRKRAESKDDYKARTGKASPDSSESLAYANYGRYVTKTNKKRTKLRITIG